MSRDAIFSLRLRVALQSGERVTRLDDLQDIDELHVVEVSIRPICLLTAG